MLRRPLNWPLLQEMMLLVVLLFLAGILLTLIIFAPHSTLHSPRDLPAQDSKLGPVLPADFKDITEPSAPTGVSEKVPEIPNLRPTTSPVSEQRSLIGGGDVYSVDQISANFEFEECETNRDFRVGTLRENIQFWSDVLQANEFILEIIREGYKIPFISLPDSYCIPNCGSTFTFR